MSSRLEKTITNAKVTLFFNMASFVLAFFSRQIFLERLGTEFLGLSTTLQNLLGFLNLAELGVGAAISYVLYKPIAEKNKTEITEIISILGYCSRWTGIAITIAGVILSCFLPIIYAKSTCSLGIIFYGYYAYLISSLIGYFMNYRMTLLSADQMNYVITKYYKTCNLIQLMLQMLFAYWIANPFIYITILLTSTVIYSFILNWKITLTYPWLKPELSKGREYLRKHNIILKYVRQIFTQKLTGLFSGQITPLFIYAFVSLDGVTCFGNYETVIAKLCIVTHSVFSSLFASVGNLIASSTQEKTLSIFKEIFSLNSFVTGLFIFGMYIHMEDFIRLWIGEQFILGHTMLVLFLMYYFIGQQSGILEMFTHGFGLFADVFIPAVESAVFVIIAIIFGRIYGQIGILSAIVASRMITWQFWKPYYLFSRGLKLSIFPYWLYWLSLIIIQFSGCLICWYLTKMLHPNQINTWFELIKAAIITAILYCLIVGPLLYFLDSGTKNVFIRIYSRFIRRYVIKLIT